MPTRCKLYAAILAAVVLALGVLGYGKTQYAAGYAKRDAEAKANEAQISRAALDKLNAANDAATRRERELRATLDQEQAQRAQEKTTYEKVIADYRSRALAGNERLRVNVARCSDSGAATGTNPAAIARPGDGERADLMPGTTDALFSVAGRIAGLVRRYDAIVAEYDRARAACNEPIGASR